MLLYLVLRLITIYLERGDHMIEDVYEEWMKTRVCEYGTLKVM
ncbi:hypothetical protein O6H91_13G063400 [Diphasiastrum complanatum]|uniref:Uncharacterized protein n=1 Tax=Diphasiastrum complanatum TaxID=34168 RepID=A0ACC2BVC5_DIPCM|nr:hypothetical protein O6H91_13G063400 [Diphasiastrum complanatum]